MSEPSAIRIQVSKEDIEGASPSQCQLCPVARALQRSGFDGAHVQNGGFWIGGAGLKVDFIVFSGRVKTRIRLYDRTGKMEPFSFWIRAEPKPARKE